MGSNPDNAVAAPVGLGPPEGPTQGEATRLGPFLEPPHGLRMPARPGQTEALGIGQAYEL